ncbi:MAG TPA: zinc-binding dehydrogenase [Mycobacteriales bacterium]|nr:zinc-binding dehydrogenase [Mycobacteriales bacterium]
MRAWITTEAGSLRLAEVAEPAPGPDEAVVAVEAFSPNRGETFVLEQAVSGFRPGKDVAGVVVKPAASGHGPRAGARVVAHLDHSGWAERAAVPVGRLAVLPEAISTTEAAALPLAGLTALRLTRATGPLASRRVLLTGASGGVGHYFVELAAAQGAQITVVTAGEDRSRRLIELGATGWVSDPAEGTGRFDVALDSVGGSSTATVLSKLTEHGLLVWFGQASRTAPTVDFFDWTGGSSATIRRFLYTDDPTPVADDLATLVRLTATGRLHPEIGLVAGWEDTPQIIDAMVTRMVRGNAVLTIPSPQTIEPDDRHEPLPDRSPT